MSSPLLHQTVNSAGLNIALRHVRETVLKPLGASSPSPLLLLPLCLYPVVNAICRKIHEDYKLFISLGPGGTPSTPLGYLKVSVLRLLIANSDVLTPPRHDPIHDKPSSYFGSVLDLPSRKGVRPVLAGIAPQRQISQRNNDIQIAALQAGMRALASENPDILVTGRSCFEKQSLAIFLKGRRTKHGEEHSCQTPPETNVNFSDLQGVIPSNSTCGLPPEIAHMHGSEGSLHLTLHPEDAAVVLQRGWGERHPLAGAGGLVRDICNGQGLKVLYGKQPSDGWLPKGFVMIYAPRDEDERKVVGKIVRAGAWWVGGVRLKDSLDF